MEAAKTASEPPRRIWRKRRRSAEGGLNASIRRANSERAPCAQMACRHAKHLISHPQLAGYTAQAIVIAQPSEPAARGSRYLAAGRVGCGRSAQSSATPCCGWPTSLARRAGSSRRPLYCTVSPGSGFSARSFSIAARMRFQATAPSMSPFSSRSSARSLPHRGAHQIKCGCPPQSSDRVPRSVVTDLNG
jgi:hypothetical protein